MINVQAGGDMELSNPGTGTVVTVSGNSSDWDIVVSDGAVIELIGPNGENVFLTAEAAAQQVVFDDGSADLQILGTGDSAVIDFGGQTVTDTQMDVDLSPEPVTQTVTVTADITPLDLPDNVDILRLQVEGDATISEITGASLTDIIVTGDSNLVIQEPLPSGVELVDARAMLGDLRVVYPNENDFTHLGGIGDDFVVVAANGLDDADMVDGGAGSNDVLSLFESIDGGAGVTNIEVIALADGGVSLDLVNDLPNNAPDSDTNGDASFDSDDLFILFEAGSHDEAGETSTIANFNADNDFKQLNVRQLGVDDFADFEVNQNGANLELTSPEDFEGTIVLANTLQADINGDDFLFSVVG
ncbi:MAG: hypothetical protein GVY13_12565 [Alphaproteobacteria bacterium]|nr:hypothetical protein [Alphaproteobacteria bacterium]